VVELYAMLRKTLNVYKFENELRVTLNLKVIPVIPEKLDFTLPKIERIEYDYFDEILFCYLVCVCVKLYVWRYHCDIWQ